MRRPNLGEIPQQGVCPYLVNNMNRPCPNQRHCRFSHDRQDILEWQQTKGRLMCSSGSTCRYLRSRTCMFTHPPQDRDPAKMDRSEQMSLDLSYKEKVVVGVLNGNTKFVGITNDREISSFNNISSTEIAVPGMPPFFTPPTIPFKLPLDRENHSLPPNNLQFENPFGALLKSVQVMNPELDVFGAADVMCTAGVLYQLFRIFDNKTSCEQRFDIEWRDKTLLLSKWSKDPSYDYTGGCGAGFEHATCDYPAHADDILKHSRSHHRVIFYRFAGLKCIVQSEVDAYCCSCDHSPASSPPLTTSPPKPDKKQTLSDSFSRPPTLWQQRKHKSNSLTLSNSWFSILTLDDPGDSPSIAPSSAETPPPPPLDLVGHTPLQIHRTKSAHIPLDCLIELKTQSTNRPQQHTPHAQLYFSRRSKLYVGLHEKGLFKPAGGEDSGVKDKTMELRNWEQSREVQGVLGKVGRLLEVVRERIRELEGSFDLTSGEGSKGKKGLSLICSSDGSGTEEGVEVGLWEREMKE